MSELHAEDTCIFCRIVRGDAPSHPVFADEKTLVFMDIRPVARGHTLIITREHFENLFEATPEAMAAVASLSVRVARAIREVLEPDGVFVAQTNGVAAGQTVFHYHLHLIPRQLGDVTNLHSRVLADAGELAQIALELGAALERSA